MDTFDLIRAERLRLADELADLSDEEWQHPSLCAGWTAHVVAAHLNLGWAVSAPRFLLGIVKARGNVDRTMDQFSREQAQRWSPADCVENLRQHASDRFTPPRFGPEAPLTDVVIHGADILQPLGRQVAVDPDAMRVVLDFLTTKAKAPFSPRSVAAVQIDVKDLDMQLGTGGAELSGPALAVCGALLRRDPFVDQLAGPGVAVLRSRP